MQTLPKKIFFQRLNRFFFNCMLLVLIVALFSVLSLAESDKSWTHSSKSLFVPELKFVNIVFLLISLEEYPEAVEGFFAEKSPEYELFDILQASEFEGVVITIVVSPESLSTVVKRWSSSFGGTSK